MSKVSERLKKAGIDIPKPMMPPGPYLPFVKAGDLLFLNGQLAETGGRFIAGRVGENMSLEDGYAAARTAALKVLYQTRVACDGDLDRVVKIVKLTGYINCVAAFTEHPKVMNGASDLMIAAFGEAIGRHARVAAGVSSLPFGVPVEIEAVVQIRT